MTGLRAVCPGIEHGMERNSTEQTMRRINVTDCAGQMPSFPAQPGVVVGVCGSSTTFCKMHVKVTHNMYIYVHLQRLAYWCRGRQWETQIHFTLTGPPVPLFPSTTVVSCRCHTSRHTFFLPAQSHVYVMHSHSPDVSMEVDERQHVNFITKPTSQCSWNVVVPKLTSRTVFDEQLKWPPGFITMISVQQSFSPTACPSYASHLRMMYQKMYESRPSVDHVCYDNLTPVTILPTSHLQLQLVVNWNNVQLKLYVSALPQKHQPHLLPGKELNCSVPHYSTFQDHVDCNFKRECEDGRDERAQCPFSSPGCQGLVASHNKCFRLHRMEFSPIVFHEYECSINGGRLASIKTRREQKNSLYLFKHYTELKFTCGYTSGWNHVPFMYSKFRKWSDGTIIYEMNHFNLSKQYHPSRTTLTVEFNPMRIDYHRQTKSVMIHTALCETKQKSPRIIPLQISLPSLSFPSSIYTSTKQVLTVCQDKYVVQTFLLYEVQGNCGKPVYVQLPMPGHNSTTRSHGMIIAETLATLRCDDGITTTHYSFVCDFRQDCPDGTDESFCEHPSCSGFVCANSQCIASSQRCNEHSDCLDDSDELKCPEKVTYFQVEVKSKRQQLYIILDGTGYFRQYRMEAPESCPDSHYSCTAEWLYCLPVYTRCNGFSDCVRGEDEENCEKMSCPYRYQCRQSRTCVHPDHLCDGVAQCPRQDDELLCDLTCPAACLCHGHSFLCHQPFSAQFFPRIRYLDGSGSGMSMDDLSNNIYLIHLNLSNCSLGNTSGLHHIHMQSVDFTHNNLATLDITVLMGLPNLKTVLLSDNPLQRIANVRQRSIVYSLERMDVAKTHLPFNELNSGVPVYFPSLRYLNLSFSALDSIGTKGFKTMPQLILLDLRGQSVKSFPCDLFSMLHHLKMIFTSDYRLCCEHLFPLKTGERRCITVEAVLLSCGTLLPSQLHVVFFWFVSASAIIGNLVCSLISFIGQNILENKLLITRTHLNVADICMGYHTVIVLIANNMYHGKYIRFEETWTTSVLCKWNGLLFLLSCKVSVFITLVITLDHTVVLFFPYNGWSFSKRSAALTCVVLWFVGLLLSSIPFNPGLSHWGLSGQSGLCRLALFQGDTSNQGFRWFTVVVAMNSFLCLLIVTCQAAIHKHIPKHTITSEPTNRSLYSSVYLMGTVAVTIAISWVLFGLVTILCAGGVAFCNQLYGTLVVFLSPLSSALNPILYLWNLASQRKQRLQENRLLNVLKSRIDFSAKMKSLKNT